MIHCERSCNTMHSLVIATVYLYMECYRFIYSGHGYNPYLRVHCVKQQKEGDMERRKEGVA